MRDLGVPICGGFGLRKHYQKKSEQGHEAFPAMWDFNHAPTEKDAIHISGFRLTDRSSGGAMVKTRGSLAKQ